MYLALLLTLAVHPLGAPGALQDGVSAELRSILPDLRRIDRWDQHGRRHLVSDARVVQLEDRLGEYLGLPPVLRVKLTTISGHRREVAKNGSITAWVHHRATGIGLGYARIVWSGESVHVSGGLRFQDAESPRTFRMADLPAFYGRVGELLELVAPPTYPLEEMSSFSGSPSGDTPGFRATVAIRVPCELGEKYLSVQVSLPLAEGDGPFAGPADRRVDVRRALDAGLEVLARLEFDFPHSMRLVHAEREPFGYELNLDPYRKDHRPLPVHVLVHRAHDATTWTVTDTLREGDPTGIELPSFVALANRVQALTMPSGSRIGVLGLARGTAPEAARALLVTVDGESIWSAERGQVVVLSVDEAGETSVVERSELGELRHGVPAGNVREAVSTSGKAFHLFVPIRGDIFMRNPPPRVLRYGSQAYVPVGGRLSD